MVSRIFNLSSICMRLALCVAVTLAASSYAAAQQVDWDSVSYVKHSELQATTILGAPAYDGTFPIRLVGVVLNNTEDWLDPTPAYDSGFHMFQMGGEAEFYVQPVDLDGTQWDPFPGEAFDDHSGTACWIGQNYGNHIMHQDPAFSYTDAEFTAELGRLNLYGGDGVVDRIIAGDLVEVRARAGLHYAGKYNINEQHNTSPDVDFEIVRLIAGYGLPQAQELDLVDMKDSNDEFYFTGSTGICERLQSSRVKLIDVQLESDVVLTADSDFTVWDSAFERSINIHIGLNASFSGLRTLQAGKYYSMVGILDQSATDGVNSDDGYQLLVTNNADIALMPIAIQGDANGDGVVNLDDFIILKRNYGRTNMSFSQGDFSGDGVVNIDDFIILKQNYGASY